MINALITLLFSYVINSYQNKKRRNLASRYARVVDKSRELASSRLEHRFEPSKLGHSQSSSLSEHSKMS